MRFTLILSAVVVTSAPSLASAHIHIESPPSRYESQKSGPCGSQNDARTDRVTVLAPGATITLEWTETVDHPSHYRVAFDEDGTDDFVDPSGFDDFYSNDAVLIDEIADKGGGAYTRDVTLPDVTCERCTLQLIQVMYDKSPYGPEGGDDIYYQCADLALRPGGAVDGGAGGPAEADAGIGPGHGGGKGGCRTTPGTGSAGAALLLALALAARRLSTR